MMDEKWANDYTNFKNNIDKVVRLKDPPCGDLGIINIYAPNNRIEICNL